MASGRDFTLVYDATLREGCSRDEVGDVFCDVRPGRGGCGVCVDARLYGRAVACAARPIDAHTLWLALSAPHLA